MASGNNILPLPHSARIEAQAAAWIARLDRDQPNASDLAAFEAWCKLSDLHQQAVDRLSSLWSDMDCLRGLSSIEPYVAPAVGNTPKPVPLPT